MSGVQEETNRDCAALLPKITLLVDLDELVLHGVLDQVRPDAALPAGQIVGRDDHGGLAGIQRLLQAPPERHQQLRLPRHQLHVSLQLRPARVDLLEPLAEPLGAASLRAQRPLLRFRLHASRLECQPLGGAALGGRLPEHRAVPFQPFGRAEPGRAEPRCGRAGGGQRQLPLRRTVRGPRLDIHGLRVVAGVKGTSGG
uniref:Uncharacterized protein n=1 Tax=Scleropages formosus TaxID=113540 RepID=A0A8C9W0D3_SCLFO